MATNLRLSDRFDLHRRHIDAEPLPRLLGTGLSGIVPSGAPDGFRSRICCNALAEVRTGALGGGDAGHGALRRHTWGLYTNVDCSRNSIKPVRQLDTIPLPEPTLLQRQPEPDCAFRGPVSQPITAEETRQKLDYEQQCYRAAERIVRARLEELQDAVQKTIKAARRL
jgi:hypothetical protein